MQVLIDSNIYKRDLTLDQGKFRLLFSQAGEGQFQLVLPEVVARETSELYRREVIDQAEALKKSAKRLRTLEAAPFEPPEPIDAEAAAAEFRQRLEAKVSSAHGQLLPLPEIPHDKLVDKAVRKRRPFRGKGPGYRDALIWQNALTLATEGKTVALVTDNYKDFADPSGLALHPDLTAELEQAGASADSVLLYRDLDTFLDAWARKAGEVVQRVRGKLEEQESLTSLEDQLSTTLSQFELPHEGRSILANLNVDPEGAWIETIDRVKSIEVTQAYILGEKNAVIELEATVEAMIDFLAHKGDLYGAERAWDLGDEIDPAFYIYDYDYNEVLAAAEAPVSLSLVLEAIFNVESGELDEIEVAHIEATGSP